MSHLMRCGSTWRLQLILPRVVIVGGGFGGLSAARALRNAPVGVTLIDKRNYHLFRPMLYQVATALLSADEISGPLRSIFSHQKNVDVLLDEVTGINSAENKGLGERGRNRTFNLLIKSQLLCQLSYAPFCGRGKMLPGRHS